MFAKSDLTRNAYMLKGPLARKGYDWWWHSFTGKNVRTGEEKAFFVEYFLCNPHLAKDRLDKQPSYLMVKVGCWGENAKQLHRFIPWEKVNVKKDAPYVLVAEDCYATDHRIRGSVKVTEQEVIEHPEYMCQAGSMKWDIKVRKEIPFHVGYGAGRLFRDLNAFEMYWHAEGMKTLYKGKIVMDGEEYRIHPDTCYGYADKNWGSDFTSPWVWLSSNHLTSNLTGKELKNSVFDIGGGKPRVFGIPLNRKLLGAFYYEGKEFEFNFSKFWTLTRTKFDCEETDTEVIWRVKQQNLHAIMDTEIHCKKKDMLLINYRSPDGEKRHNRLWNGGTGYGVIRLYQKHHGELTMIDEIFAQNVGCEYGEYGSSPK